MQPDSQIKNKSAFTIQTAMWMLVISVVLLFAAFSFGYFSTVPEGIKFDLPYAFYISTAILMLGSGVLHKSLQSQNFNQILPALNGSLLVGIVFFITQSWGWYEIYQQKLQLDDTTVNGFQYLYLLTGMHALHMLGAWLFLLFVRLRYHKTGHRYLEAATYFWHFLGLLWIYLLVVLVINI